MKTALLDGKEVTVSDLIGSDYCNILTCPRCHMRVHAFRSGHFQHQFYNPDCEDSEKGTMGKDGEMESSILDWALEDYDEIHKDPSMYNEFKTIFHISYGMNHAKWILDNDSYCLLPVLISKFVLRTWGNKDDPTPEEIMANTCTEPIKTGKNAKGFHYDPYTTEHRGRKINYYRMSDSDKGAASRLYCMREAFSKQTVYYLHIAPNISAATAPHLPFFGEKLVFVGMTPVVLKSDDDHYEGIGYRLVKSDSPSPAKVKLEKLSEVGFSYYIPPYYLAVDPADDQTMISSVRAKETLHLDGLCENALLGMNKDKKICTSTAKSSDFKHYLEDIGKSRTKIDMIDSVTSDWVNPGDYPETEEFLKDNYDRPRRKYKVENGIRYVVYD